MLRAETMPDLLAILEDVRKNNRLSEYLLPPVLVSSIARSDIFYTPLGDIRTSDRRYLHQS